MNSTASMGKMRAFVLALLVVSSTEAFTASSRSRAFQRTSPTLKRSLFPPSVITTGSPQQRLNDSTALFWFWPSSTTTDEDNKSSYEKSSDAKKSTKLSLSGDANEGLLPSPFFLGNGALSAPPTSKTLEEIVDPVAIALEENLGIGNWAFSYADLEPEDETTPIGISFLLTNMAYGLIGALLMSQGNAVLGALTELACVASFCYHYAQLKYGQQGSSVVRLTLLVDYFFAIIAMLVGSIQLFSAHQLPAEAAIGGALAIGSLGACWVWEEGLTYIFFHSLWHLFSAYTGFVIGSLS